jgi:hypothetical protein
VIDPASPLQKSCHGSIVHLLPFLRVPQMMTFRGVLGERNHNGIVDAADYVVRCKDTNRTQAQYNG